ncbi:SDR family oxidoreductase [Pseudonocardia charpentierae]|uniref:SDR family oxidoreductase n=1 Tax=Pseudonocardia charpentierae TaxID=3075545 RepID=A0ABU2NI30_9PSEU|nr:SDR family oxidoreductase [Pseudonocardia sp. DSM 45834]MDT0353217.1 SDR family oxidoreductase [Pseudonocardia sp. DSM 45834]
MALAFAREGADVLIPYLESEEKDAQETVRLIEDAGRKAVKVPGISATRPCAGAWWTWRCGTKGIRVDSVAPGPVWTPLIPATMDEEKVKSFGEQSPMGRSAQPAELAPSYVFLASQKSSYITADVIAVTGGSPIV